MLRVAGFNRHTFECPLFFRTHPALVDRQCSDADNDFPKTHRVGLETATHAAGPQYLRSCATPTDQIQHRGHPTAAPERRHP